MAEIVLKFSQRRKRRKKSHSLVLKSQKDALLLFLLFRNWHKISSALVKEIPDILLQLKGSHSSILILSQEFYTEAGSGTGIYIPGIFLDSVFTHITAKRLLSFF